MIKWFRKWQYWNAEMQWAYPTKRPRRFRMFQKTDDGGPKSGTTAYFLVEIKSMFSIALLRFDNFAPERFHTHAFNAFTIWLSGNVLEHHRNGARKYFKAFDTKVTTRNTFHKIEAIDKPAWAISFRGPWADTWNEDRSGKLVTLTHGRKEL